MDYIMKNINADFWNEFRLASMKEGRSMKEQILFEAKKLVKKHSK